MPDRPGRWLLRGTLHHSALLVTLGGCSFPEAMAVHGRPGCARQPLLRSWAGSSCSAAPPAGVRARLRHCLGAPRGGSCSFHHPQGRRRAAHHSRDCGTEASTQAGSPSLLWPPRDPRGEAEAEPPGHSHVLLAQQLAPHLHHEAIEMLALKGRGQARRVWDQEGSMEGSHPRPPESSRPSSRHRHTSASLRGAWGSPQRPKAEQQGSRLCCPLTSLPNPSLGARGQLCVPRGRAPPGSARPHLGDQEQGPAELFDLVLAVPDALEVLMRPVLKQEPRH